MNDMDDLEAGILGLARQELKLSVEHKERHLVALQSAITVGVGPRLATSEPPSAPALQSPALHSPALGAPAATTPWFSGAAAKLVAWSAASALFGAALGFAAGYRVASPSQNPRIGVPVSAPIVVRPLVDAPPSTTHTLAASEPAPSNASQETAPHPTRHADKPEAAVPARVPASPSQSSPSQSSPNPSSPNPSEVESMQEELSYLRRAQNALGSGDPRSALGLVKSLDEQMPSGRMLPEREVTRILSLCALGTHDEAKARGRAFLLTYGKTLYAERVRRSCAGETETPVTQH